MRKLIILAASCLSVTPVHAQSTGIPWVNGRVLTDRMLQTLDQAKMNINSLGKPGFAPKLNALGQITDPIVGDVSHAKATADGQTVVDVAAKAANAVQSNGGDASKTVVTPTGDTASQALSDVAAQATGSVQKTAIGAANGVAPLDDNKMMSAAVSGDSSASPVTVNGSTTSRTISDHFSDSYNLSDFGAKMMSLSELDADSITAALSHVPSGSTVQIPCGAWWPGQGDANGNAWAPTTTNWYVYDATRCPLNTTDDWPSPGHLNKFIGDGNVYLYNNAHGRVSRRFDSTFTGYPFYNIIYESKLNTNSETGTSVMHLDISNGGGWNDAFSGALKNHLNVGIDLNLQDYRNDPGNSGITGDTAQVVRMNKFMPNSNTWAFAYELDDWSGHTPSAEFAQTNEIDQVGNGHDNAASDYNPRASHRRLLYFSPTTRTYGWSLTSYAASKAYSLGDMVIINISGTDYMFICTTAGTSGASAPTWTTTTKENDTITDGSVVWTRGAQKDETVGVDLWLNRNPNDNVMVGTGISGNQEFINAFIDTTQMTFRDSLSAAIRIGHDQIIDLSGNDLDASGADGGRNQHTLTYNSTDKAFEYKAAGNTLLSVGDDGSLTTPSAIVAPTGTTISDATTSTSYITYIGYGSSTSGIKTSSGVMSGKTQVFINTNANPILLYPFDSSWRFSGKSNGAPITIPAKGMVMIYSLSEGQYDQTEIGFVVTQNGLPTVMTKSNILALTSPVEGQTVYDSDDHADVTYRCPTASTCGWSPVQYGAALSN